MGVSGQNQQFVTVCSMCSAILFPGHWWHVAESRETIIVPFNPASWRQEPKALSPNIYKEARKTTLLPSQRMRWVHVWIHRGWVGYMYRHREGEPGTAMDTQRVKWVKVGTHRG